MRVGVGAGGGVRRAPLASVRAPRTCGCRGAGAAALSAEQPPPLALAGPAHTFMPPPAIDFPFLPTAPVPAPTFRLKLPFSACSSFARLGSPFSCLFFLFFFPLLGNHQNSNRCTSPKPRAPAARARARCPRMKWSGGAGHQWRLGGAPGWIGGELASSGERLTAGSGAGRGLNAEFCLGTTCQEEGG